MNANSLDNARFVRLGGFAVLLISAWSLVAAYSIHAGLPTNLVHLPFEEQINASFWMTERFQFFTESSREAVIRPYLQDTRGEWRLASIWPQFQASNAFGLSRAPRIQIKEEGLLLMNWSSASFRACKDDPATCLKQAPILIQATNTYPLRTLCGNVGFVAQAPVPFTWLNSAHVPLMPSKILAMHVSCP